MLHWSICACTLVDPFLDLTQGGGDTCMDVTDQTHLPWLGRGQDARLSS